ncbi:MAG: response regulator [Beijerinckiaceae bacterium]|nr:response regulator [Beijerinckiaceae bacterium]
MALVSSQADAKRLVIVEDEAQLLELMKEVFVGAGYRVKGFGCAEDLIADLDWITSVDCIIADVRLPGMDGLELLKFVTERHPAIPIVIMTGHGDIPMAVKAIKDGAFDFIEKPFTPERLEEIVVAALASRPRLRTLLDVKDAENTLSRLTPRQVEIVDLIAEGLTSKEIAVRLGMSFRTVDTHRARIMEKLQVSSLAELLRLRLAAEFSGS